MSVIRSLQIERQTYDVMIHSATMHAAKQNPSCAVEKRQDAGPEGNFEAPSPVSKPENIGGVSYKDCFAKALPVAR